MKVYTFDDAERVILNCHGFDDSSTGAGFAWAFIVEERQRHLQQIERLIKCLPPVEADHSNSGCIIPPMGEE